MRARHFFRQGAAREMEGLESYDQRALSTSGLMITGEEKKVSVGKEYISSLLVAIVWPIYRR